MCPDRESTMGMPVPPAGGDTNFSRRLPPPAMWLARAALALGVIFVLLALPMSADYNSWNHTPYPTYGGLFLTTLALIVFYPTIPLVLSFYISFFICVANASRRGGPRRSLLISILSIPLCASWALYIMAVRWWGLGSFQPLYGYPAFATGCTLMFFSTLPGLYYWIKFRLSRKNGET